MLLPLLLAAATACRPAGNEAERAAEQPAATGAAGSGAAPTQSPDPTAANGAAGAPAATGTGTAGAPAATGTAGAPAGTGARRIVAIGDIHGDLAAAKRALRLAGVLGEDESWSGGATVLVQTGDVLDRGNDEPEIMALLETLRRQAEDAGGEVVLLNGNHELMNALGDLRYVTPEGFSDYATTPTDDLPRVDEIPAIARGRVAAFVAGGPVARRLATRDVIAVIDGNVFAHGGVLPEHLEQYGVARINDESRAWLMGHGPVPAFVSGEESPVWTRRYSDEDTGADDCALLDQALEALDARRMIVGHTVQPDGITSACNDRVWRIDTGMAAHYGGPTQVLEIVGDEVRVLGE